MENNKKEIAGNKKIVSRISEYLSGLDIIIFAYIFGSFARGESFSDIDIGIYLGFDPVKSPLDIELEIEDSLALLLKLPVDVRVLNCAPDAFIFQVVKDGLLVKDKSPDMRSDFEGLIFKKVNDFSRFRNEYLRGILSAPI